VEVIYVYTDINTINTIRSKETRGVRSPIALRLVRSRAIAEDKQRSQWSVMGWVTKTLSPRAPPCFGRHVKPLVPAAFAVVSTHQSALGSVVGYGPFSL
jgi:hypothetical protein